MELFAYVKVIFDTFAVNIHLTCLGVYGHAKVYCFNGNIVFISTVCTWINSISRYFSGLNFCKPGSPRLLTSLVVGVSFGVPYLCSPSGIPVVSSGASGSSTTGCLEYCVCWFSHAGVISPSRVSGPSSGFLADSDIQTVFFA